MDNFDYKKYSLENLETWLHDAISSGEATPKEIYDVIHKVVEEEYHYFKHHTSRCYELLALLNGNGYLTKDDKPSKYQKALYDFWQDNNSSEESSQYTEEELNAMCDAAEDKEKCREYNLREAEYYDKRTKLDVEYEEIMKSGGYDWTPEIKKVIVIKWQLPIEVDGISGEYYVQFPDDLMEAANIKEDDLVEWIDRGDGGFELRKVTKPLGLDEC